MEFSVYGLSTALFLDETYTKFGADGKLEDYWCSTGEKLVIPPEYISSSEFSLACEPTAILIDTKPISIFSSTFGDHNKIRTWTRFFCDV
jgi:hypothetical protein